ncbi:hypothetical protein BDZ45DRAFT_732495 [Acephala macrosclerotiorum]|nr:hypothetical protein BDZ45DRAFT_732495 [Acephala macrosclerotiorum]
MAILVIIASLLPTSCAALSGTARMKIMCPSLGRQGPLNIAMSELNISFQRYLGTASILLLLLRKRPPDPEVVRDGIFTDRTEGHGRERVASFPSSLHRLDVLAGYFQETAKRPSKMPGGQLVTVDLVHSHQQKLAALGHQSMIRLEVLQESLQGSASIRQDMPYEIRTKKKRFQPRHPIPNPSHYKRSSQKRAPESIEVPERDIFARRTTSFGFSPPPDSSRGPESRPKFQVRIKSTISKITFPAKLKRALADGEFPRSSRNCGECLA